jgi:ABC-type multidrug transport system fused ATPase/permease subunit
MEIPKQIINNVLNSSHFPIVVFSLDLDQSEFLFLLCILYLVVVLASALIKYVLNVAKGYVSERFGRRLRVLIYRKWRTGTSGERKAEIIPIVGQEIEALGGFAAEVVTLPLLQGGTLLTIVLFMLVQDPLLGIAALTVVPIQVLLLPRLQRRVNEQSRARIKKVRNLGVELGDQLLESRVPMARVRIIAGLFRDLESIRRRVYRMKFFNKALNNVLTSLTPFFFFSLGGYFVLQERISLGALVAVLAAHKEFSSPMNDLFAYYQMIEDTRLRYREVHQYFGRREARFAESVSADNSGVWGVADRA